MDAGVFPENKKGAVDESMGAAEDSAVGGIM
jgi:hypothetical protein